MVTDSTTPLLQRIRGPLITAGVLGPATLALHFRDPHVSGSWGYCPMYALLGVQCPLCGGLRAVNDLTRGDLSAAWESNALLIIAIPIFVVWFVIWTHNRIIGKPTEVTPQTRRAMTTSAVIVAVTFGVARDLLT